MIVQYASDLHLEFFGNKKFLEANPIIKSGDILILAGDTIYMDPMYYNMEIFDQWSKMYEAVYLLPGNHEFYNRSFPISQIFPSMVMRIRENIFLVNNHTVLIDGISFVFSTLFTRIDPVKALDIRRSLGDFRQSEFIENGMMLSVKEYDNCHSKCIDFIESALGDLGDKKCVLITHHVPFSSKLIPDYPHPPNSLLSSAFHVDQTNWMRDYNIEYCLSGHTHFNHDPIKIHNTTCLTNQMGYVEWGEHWTFDSQKSFDIQSNLSQF